jgi:uncharacterized protein (TIGR00730 family)
MKSIAIFCGSAFNGDPAIIKAIDELAGAFAARNITMVFGGANVGTMGILADAVLSRGGKVTGVLPQFLMDREIAHTGLTELHIVDSMHQRKQLMTELSDGIITLPGGAGTLDEYFEAFTWLQLGLHSKPVGILNLNGFYDPLLQQFDVMVAHGFLKPDSRKMVLASPEINNLLDLMASFSR